ncbi:MAG: DUF4832 domain-containing protein [Planctomycetota bacterium]|jgi:hypothetical protein
MAVLLAGNGFAGSSYWSGGASGPWNDTWTWGNGTNYPVAGDFAYLNVGSTVTIDGTAEAAGELHLASWSGDSDLVTLNLINGSSLDIAGVGHVGVANGDVGLLSIDASSTITVNGVLNVGYNGNGTLDVNGGTVNASGGLYVSNPWASGTGVGTVHLYNGTINVSTDFAMSATGLIDIHAGTLSIEGLSWDGVLNGLIGANQIIAYGGTQTVNIDHVGNDTVLTAVPNPIGQTVTYTPASGEIFNPERGFYGWGPMDDSTDYDWIRSQGYSLCYANIDLSSYRQSNINTPKLNELQRAFDRMRSAGVKGIVRITYDNTSAGEDATLAWMETHLQQLQPLFGANTDMVAFFQAGMIGAWGEWHSSSNDHHLNPQPVWDLLVAYLPPERTIAVRTPAFVNQLEGLDVTPLTPAEAFTGTGRARIAHHNDCWIASITDMGTYDNYSVIREQEKDQIALQSRYTPWGGESCNPSSFSNCGVAEPEAQRFHATDLNASYEENVINELTTGGCWLTTFAEKLGYRFTLIDAVLPTVLKKGREFSVSIQIQNDGWAPVYNERPVFLRILDGATVIADVPLTQNADPRRWLPEDGVITLGGVARTPSDVTAASVSLALWLPDSVAANQSNPDFSIQLANDNTWDAAQGHNILISSIDVIDFVPGDMDGNLTVNLIDLQLFVERWLDDCFTSDWCGDRDIDESGRVDLIDYSALSLEWDGN